MSGEIPAEVYQAAARAYDEAVNAALGNPPGSVLGEEGRDLWVTHPAFRASTDSAYAAGVAAGRAQAAADIRASIPEVADYVWDASAPVQREIAAQIAEGGDPR